MPLFPAYPHRLPVSRVGSIRTRTIMKSIRVARRESTSMPTTPPSTAPRVLVHKCRPPALPKALPRMIWRSRNAMRGKPARQPVPRHMIWRLIGTRIPTQKSDTLNSHRVVIYHEPTAERAYIFGRVRADATMPLLLRADASMPLLLRADASMPLLLLASVAISGGQCSSPLPLCGEARGKKGSMIGTFWSNPGGKLNHIINKCTCQGGVGALTKVRLSLGGNRF